jgi:hypothetical protein
LARDFVKDRDYCVSDIFQEVDEEVRREQLKKLWERYGHYLVALAVLLVAGVGAYRGWEYYQAKQAAEAGARFDAAMELSDADGKSAEAQAAFAKIAADGTSGYRVLARLQESAELGKRDAKAAVAAYDAISADTSVAQPLRNVASVRAAILLVDSAPLAEINRRLETLATPDGSFRHTAREMLALAAYRANDTGALKRWLDAMAGDGETPQGLRVRMEALRALTPEVGKG